MKIIEGIIREYDIECACLSMLISKGKISEQLFLDLKEADKLTRNILIGKLQINNEELKEIIKNGIETYVNQIIKSLKSPLNVLEVSKDAIFILNDLPDQTKLDDYVNFVLKNEYFLCLEIPISNDSKMSVKLYKNRTDITVRFSKINKDHEAYPLLFELLNYKISNNFKSFFRDLPTFKNLLCNSKERLIAALDNNRLYDAISELM